MSHSTAVQPFEFKGRNVRVVVQGDDPWFVLADVCRILEHSNPSVAARLVDADDLRTVQKTDIPTLNWTSPNPNVQIVSESGFYALAFASRAPGAPEFRRWVTHEVLPQIRKTGAYVTPAARPSSDLDVLQAMLDSMRADRERVAAVEEQARELDARVGAIEGRHDWFSALGYARLHALNTSHTWLNLLGRTAASIGRRNGIRVQKTQHSLFGEVNMWPEWIWAAAVEARRAAGDARATEVEWS